MASPAKRAKPSPAKPLGEKTPEEDPIVLLRRRWELASVLHFLRVSLGFLTPSRDLRIVYAVLGLKRAIHVIRVLARGSQVFEPAIKEDLELSADDIETALVSNNGNLARLHIALLKVVYLPLS
jgi:hypothetical protein